MRYGIATSRVNRQRLTATSGSAADVLLVWVFDTVVGDTLDLADMAHAHTAETVAVSQQHVTDLADMAHAHTAETVAVSQQHVTDLADMAHAHTAGTVQVEVEGVHLVNLADAAHAHTAETVAISQQHLIDLVNAAHTHTADTLSISDGGALALITLILSERSGHMTAKTRGEVINLSRRLLEFHLGKRDSDGGKE